MSESGFPRFEGYEVTGEVSSGALATVYRALQEPLGRKVAIKALKSTIAPQSSFATQLEREAHVLADLMHPNIVILLDFVKTSSQMYLVLEYIGGFSLAEVIAKTSKLRPESVAAIGAEVAKGLAHAHERGIVHRDVKPANVILSRNGDVKIVDFGISQRDKLPTANELLLPSAKESAFGTPAYMAPEQILGETLDARSDVFSLGVVLYQLLCGVRPFEREGKRSGHSARRDPAEPLRHRAPDVPRTLERLVMRCIEKLPADRPASANTVAMELQEFIAERGGATTRDLVRSALASARLVSGTEPGKSHVPTKPSFLQSPWSLALLTGVLVLGDAGIRVTDDAKQASAQERWFRPAPTGELRVLATPWADVSVDGQLVDTTPFARPIVLTAGLHYVTFAHPHAPPETRKVDIESGKTVVLDVTMRIEQEADGGSP